VATHTISVVVPCYNYARYVRCAVESAVHQPGVELDIVVVNDCSTDDSAAVLEALEQEYASVRVLHHTENQGLITTINDGIEVAVGDVLLVLSADDCLAPGALQRAALAFDLHPEVGMVFGPRIEFAESSVLPDIARYRELAEPADRSDIHVHDGGAWVTERCRQGINMLASPEVLVRLPVQRRIGGYDPNCRHTSDLNMWLRAAMASDVAFVAGTPFAYYRKHGLNMSVVEFGNLATDLTERWTAFDRAIGSSDAGVATQQRWRLLARQALATEAQHELRRASERGADAEGTAALEQAARRIGHDGGSDPGTEGPPPQVRRDYLGRLMHRLRWRRWLKRWQTTGL
jgi:glycosyltransferase involved in cell wall biosynthesis